VLTIFKQSHETIFRAIHLVDLYLKSEKNSQTVKDLHLIGIVSMFIASKLHEVYPIKLSNVVKDISKGKFTRSQIQKMETIMLKRVKFQINAPTLYCFSNSLFRISGIPPKHLNSIEKYGMLIQKMFLYSYDILNVFTRVQLAVFSAIISLKLFEHSYRDFGVQKIIYHLIKHSEIPKGQILDNLNFLRDFASNFKINFPFNRLRSSKSQNKK
jgi:hypothetical protein